MVASDHVREMRRCRLLLLRLLLLGWLGLLIIIGAVEGREDEHIVVSGEL